MNGNGSTTALAQFGEQGIARQDGGAMAIVAAAESRALAEVNAAMAAAKRFPRNQHAAVSAIVESCKRYGMADTALYAYSRGGSPITGATIRLAEVMATAWGNLQFGVIELERRGNASVMEAYCWDLQSNVRNKKTFTVPHEKKANNAIKSITDPRDIYEHIANQSARRLRECILQIIPPDVRALAVEQVEATLALGPVDASGKPVQTRDARIIDMVQAFSDLGVSVEDLEKFIGRSTKQLTDHDLMQLRTVWKTVSTDPAQRAKFFGGAPATTSDLNDQFDPARQSGTSPTDEPAEASTPEPAAVAPDAGGAYVITGQTGVMLVDGDSGEVVGQLEDTTAKEQASIPGTDAGEERLCVVLGQLGESGIHGKTLAAFSRNAMQTIDSVRAVVGNADREGAITILAKLDGITRSGALKVLNWCDAQAESTFSFLRELLLEVIVDGEAMRAAYATITGGCETFNELAYITDLLTNASREIGDDGQASELAELLGNFGI